MIRFGRKSTSFCEEELLVLLEEENNRIDLDRRRQR